MKKLHSKKITKQIVLIIAIIMLCNFTMPLYSYAVSTEDGGSELENITKFVCFIPDTVNKLLQNMFVDPNNIYRNDAYRICYSPGIIFSGMVPGLSVNFIDPMEDKKATEYKDYQLLDSNLIEALNISDCNKDEFIRTAAHDAAEVIARAQCVPSQNSGDDTEDIYNQIAGYTRQHIDTSKLDEFTGETSDYFTYNHKCSQEEVLIKIVYRGMDWSGDPVNEWKVLYSKSNGSMNMTNALNFVQAIYNLQNQYPNYESKYNFTSDFLGSSGYTANAIINLGQFNGKTVGIGVRGFDAAGAKIGGTDQIFVITGGLNTITGFTYNELVSEQNLDTFVKGLYDSSNDKNGAEILNDYGLYFKIRHDIGAIGMFGIEQDDERHKHYITSDDNPIKINGNIFKLYYQGAGDDAHVNFMYSYQGKDVLIETFGISNADDGTLFNKTASIIDSLLMADTEFDENELNRTKTAIVNKIDNLFYELVIDITSSLTGKEKVYTSTSRVLQPIVATWYKALRRIALVGLLSALTYVGIRMALVSASAKQKAKYKKMFMDWLTALCLLFVLHYIMIFTVTIIEQINSVLSASVIGDNGEDVLMTGLRNDILEGSSWSVVLPQVIVYIVITVYSVMFTIQYIRRLVYLAFLTIIAPLITVTYPLDKIKDNKAQAFDTWIKDYIFFNLIQVVHLLLYYIFVATAVNMAARGSWVYALVCIGFLTKAENILKKMFGFEKSKSMGALGAAATGAIVTNVLNKFNKAPGGSGKGKSGEGGDESGNNGGSGSKPVRTARTDPMAGMQAMSNQGTPATGNSSNGQAQNETREAAGRSAASSAFAQNGTLGEGVEALDVRNMAVGGAGENPQGAPMVATGSTAGAGEASAQEESRERAEAARNNSAIRDREEEELSSEAISEEGERAQAGAESMPEETGDDSREEIIRKANKKIRRIRRINGALAVAKRYTGPALRTVAGAAGAAVGGTIGFAAGVAQGDIGKALGGAAGGLAAGYYTGQKAVNGAGKVLDTAVHIDKPFREAADTYREAAYGQEYADEVRQSRYNNTFKRSSQYKILKEEYRKLNTSLSDEDLDRELGEHVDKMLEAGITDSSKMTRILRKNKKHPLRFSIDKAIRYTKLAEKCPDDILYNTQKFIRFFEDMNIELTLEEIQELRNNIIEFK